MRDSKEHNDKIDFITETFSKADLIAVCNMMCLDYSGGKAILVERLCDNLMELSELKAIIEEDIEDDDDQKEDEKQEVHDSDRCSLIKNDTSEDERASEVRNSSKKKNRSYNKKKEKKESESSDEEDEDK